jgi:hypothetical protein
VIVTAGRLGEVIVEAHEGSTLLDAKSAFNFVAYDQRLSPWLWVSDRAWPTLRFRRNLCHAARAPRTTEREEHRDVTEPQAHGSQPV